MTAYAAIREALLPLGLPLEPERYDGTATTYIVYNYALDRGADFGDDGPGCNLAEVQVHLYMPLVDEATHASLNFHPLRDRIREALSAAEFTYPEVQVIRDQDRNVRHVVFSCQFSESKED